MPKAMQNILSFWGLARMAISPFLIAFLMAGHPIIIDGQFQDWDNFPVVYSDMEADGLTADFADIKITTWSVVILIILAI